MALLGAGSAGCSAPATPSAPAAPSTARWRPAAPLQQARAGHTLTTLPDGSVLAIGGHRTVYDAAPLGSVERLASPTSLWVVAGQLGRGRTDHTATLLPDGRVLIAGGRVAAADPSDHPVAADDTEIYDPTTGRSTPGPRLGAPRAGHGAVSLPDGRIWLLGGAVGPADDDAGGTSELLDPRTGASGPGPRLPGGSRLAPVSGGLVAVQVRYRTERHWLSRPTMHPDTALVGLLTPASAAGTHRLPALTSALLAGGREALLIGSGPDDGERAWKIDASGAPHPWARPPLRATGALMATGRDRYVALGVDDDGHPSAALLEGAAWRSLPPPSVERRGAPFALLPGGELLVAGGTVSGRGGDEATAASEVLVP